MTHFSIQSVIIICLLNTVSACQTQAVADTDTNSDERLPQKATGPQKVIPTMGHTELQAKIPQNVQQTLKQRLERKAPGIPYSIVRVERTVWPDASLGCPQPGMQYAQVLTPGQIIELVQGTTKLRFHTSDRGRVKECQSAVSQVRIQEHPDS